MSKKNKKRQVRKGSIGGYMLTDEQMTEYLNQSTITIGDGKTQSNNDDGKEEK